MIMHARMSMIHLCFRECFLEFCESKPKLRSMESATLTLALDTLTLGLGCLPMTLTLTEDIQTCIFNVAMSNEVLICHVSG